ncbi:MAG: HTH-type transcriptional activator CmpR [Bacteroidota bacterium]|jgi:DNA-binding transcriptional LysR family regulator
MNYTISQLKIFLKVVEFGSITKAADDLNLTQPAVSIQLKNFQKDFKFPLTEIINKKLYVTDFGREIASACENILNELEIINYKSLGYNNNYTGKLKISIVSTGKYIMPYFLSEFLNAHPDVDLLMDVTNKTKVVSSLEKNEIDFALVSILPDNLNVAELELMENQLYLVGNKEVAKEIMNNKKSIDSKPFIYREQGSGTRQMMEKFIGKNKFHTKKKIELTSNEAVKQAVIAGIGISIMPIIGIKSEIASGKLKIIETKGLPIITKWRLVWLKEKKMSPIAQHYIEYLKKEKNRINKISFSIPHV